MYFFLFHSGVWDAHTDTDFTHVFWFLFENQPKMVDLGQPRAQNGFGTLKMGGGGDIVDTPDHLSVGYRMGVGWGGPADANPHQPTANWSNGLPTNPSDNQPTANRQMSPMSPHFEGCESISGLGLHSSGSTVWGAVPGRSLGTQFGSKSRLGGA